MRFWIEQSIVILLLIIGGALIALFGIFAITTLVLAFLGAIA